MQNLNLRQQRLSPGFHLAPHQWPHRIGVGKKASSSASPANNKVTIATSFSRLPDHAASTAAMAGWCCQGDMVNVHELSSLARSTKDLLDIVEQILDIGASKKFHKENMSFVRGEEQDAFQQLMLTMLGAIAHFERNLLLERQREGIAIAKAKRRYKGKQSRFSAADIQAMKERFSVPGTNKSAMARDFGITRQHLYRLVAA